MAVLRCSTDGDDMPEMPVDSPTSKRDAAGPPSTPPDAKKSAPAGTEEPGELSLPGPEGSASSGGLHDVLEAFKANFERELQGICPA